MANSVTFTAAVMSYCLTEKFDKQNGAHSLTRIHKMTELDSFSQKKKHEHKHKLHTLV